MLFCPKKFLDCHMKQDMKTKSFDSPSWVQYHGGNHLANAYHDYFTGVLRQKLLNQCCRYLLRHIHGTWNPSSLGLWQVEGGYMQNCTLPKNVIITMYTPPKLLCRNVEETILKHLPKITLTFYNFCICYPNVTFFDVLKPPFICQQENMRIWSF